MIDTATSVMEPAVQPGDTDAPIAAVAGTGAISCRGLFERLGHAGRVILVSAPADNGQTVLLPSWLCAVGLAKRAERVPVQGERRDQQPFWVWVADALRGTAADAELGRPLTAAPDLHGWAVVERLTPVARLQTADELGNVIGFLASGPNAFLTGSTIKIDGGALVSAGV